MIALKNVIAQGGPFVYFFLALGTLREYPVQAGIVSNDVERQALQKESLIYINFIMTTWASKTLLALFGNDQDVLQTVLVRNNGYGPVEDALFVHDPKMLAFYLKVVSKVDDDTYKANLAAGSISYLTLDKLMNDMAEQNANELRDNLAQAPIPTIEWLADQKMQGEQESQKEIDMNSPEMLELLSSTVVGPARVVTPSTVALKKPMSKADQEMLNMLINFGKHMPSDFSDDVNRSRVNLLRPMLADNDRLMQKVERYFGVEKKD